jgi:predicted Zn-dependent protease
MFVRLRRLFAAAWSTRRRAAVSSAGLLLLSAACAYGGRTLWLEHHFGAARTARRGGHLDEAEAHLEVCRRAEYRPEDVNIERLLLKIIRGERVGEDYLRACVERNHPDALAILEVLIDSYLRNYRLMDARWAMDQYLARRPDEPAVLLGRAFAAEKIGDYADAEKDYRRALALAPEDTDGRRRFAELLLTRRGTPEEAAAEYERLHERDPDNAVFLLGLARCQRQAGRLNEARRLLAPLLRREPHVPGARTEMGQVAKDDGQPAEAIDWLHQAVADDPNDRVAYGVLANCLRQVGREQEERECRDRLERLDADLKRMDELTRTLLSRPYDAALRSELGVLFLRHGEEAEGLRWLGLALEVDPANSEAHHALAEYYEARGDAARAAPHRRPVPND